MVAADPEVITSNAGSQEGYLCQIGYCLVSPCMYGAADETPRPFGGCGYSRPQLLGERRPGAHAAPGHFNEQGLVSWQPPLPATAPVSPSKTSQQFPAALSPAP